MKTIQSFVIPDVPECMVELPQGLGLMGAAYNSADDVIEVFYMDDTVSEETVTLTWYVLGVGMEVADNFPGKFFARVDVAERGYRFLFFKQDAKKRDPIVAKVPGPRPVKDPK